MGVLVLAGIAVGLATKAAYADARGEATAILDQLDKDAKHKPATSGIVQRGRDALERATRMRAAGDEAHAQLADGLALELAQAGRDLVRAIDVEAAADDARRAAIDAGVVGERERALLEEGIARNGRLKAEIAELEKTKTAPGGKRTPQTAAKPADGGAP